MGADEVNCKTHPSAPHGFLRSASHNAGRYVCECEHWEERRKMDIFDTRLRQIDGKREWVGLTDEELHDLQIEHIDDPWANFKAIEAKLKDKNT